MDYEALFQNAIDELKSDGRYQPVRGARAASRPVPRMPRIHGHGAVNSVLDERLCPAGGAPGGGGPRSGVPTTIWGWRSIRGSWRRCTRRWTAVGAGAAARATSPGTHHLSRHMLERELARLHGKEAALLFTSGYISNEATLSTLARQIPGCVIFSDALTTRR